MHTGAGAGARETRHGTLVTQKKSLGGAGRCRDGRIGDAAGWCHKGLFIYYVIQFLGLGPPPHVIL